MSGKTRSIEAGLLATLLVFGIFTGVASAADTSRVSPTAAQIRAKIAKVKRARIAQDQREAAAARMQAMKEVVAAAGVSKAGVKASEYATPGPGGVPDYFGSTPNWAYSPQIRKFVDTLPGLGASNANNLGQYIALGHPDTLTYPGSDYYEISLREYDEQLHSDLPPTTLRGYVQTNNGTAGASNTVEPDPIHYLGPFIVAQRDRPVRIKFTNELPVDDGGDLFIPVDTSVMGAGEGPGGDMYTQNRGTLHLHGGHSPWISDGTPHQWITPASEDATYPKGVSVKNVPDMPDPGDGSMTFFYTNDQSARLMFYHDHSYGITRLNVYAGGAAGYMITDPVEEALVDDGIVPSDQIPLILQDKTFVDSETVRVTDPTWNWGTGSLDASGSKIPKTGDLWLPHVYVPAQNPADPGGMNATGRWHYSPWFWPPVTDIKYPPIPNPFYDPVNAPWEPELMPATPNPSMGMEAFHDTVMVNGTVYPSVSVQPKSYRLRVLNAAGDRFFNLQMYEANNTKNVTRIGGANRYEVAVNAAARSFPLWTGVTDVVITSGEDRALADSLTGAGFAGALDAPLMLNPYSSLNSRVRNAIAAMPDEVDVHIVGGTASVSNNVRNQLAAMPNVGSVERITGVNRYELAANVARRMHTALGSQMSSTTIISNGDTTDGWFAALSASPIAFKAHIPVLLVAKTGGVPSHTTAVLNELDLDERYIVGNTALVSNSIQTALGVPAGNRISGSNRYTAAVALANRALAEGWLSGPSVGVAAKVPDAATGGAHLGRADSPILFVQATNLTNTNSTYLSGHKDYIQDAFVYGGAVSVAESVRTNVRNLIQLAIKSEVAMVPARPVPGFPDTWPTDSRLGGAPDYRTRGPEWIQIATESGFLPAPAVIPQQPITWNRDPTTFNAGNVEDHSLLVAPGERADVVVDFSKYAGKTLMLYNDAPTAFPALDQRTDYFTGCPDLTDTGGTTSPRIGFAPNTRTVMQIKVAAAPPAAAFDLGRLQDAFASTDSTVGVFEAGQNPVIVPDARYGSAYNVTSFTADPYARIYQHEMQFDRLDGVNITMPLEPKAIQDETSEVWDPDYGRMSGKLGVSMPRANAGNANFVLYSFFDPPVENLQDSMTPLSPVGEDGSQIWKITHNGVDTHPIHFHLFDVQLINRVGWDNAVRPPDDNELGWKETVRISPLEDTIVALKPVAPKAPFGVPDSYRPLNPTAEIGSAMGFSSLSPTTGQVIIPPVTNEVVNFGWEYVWHCHILSHEEMDMMRPMTLAVAKSLPDTPTLGGTGLPGSSIEVTWTDVTPPGAPSSWGNPQGEIGFRLERATVTSLGVESAYSVVTTALANATAFTDDTATDPDTAYRYRVFAFNAAGEVASDPWTTAAPGYFAALITDSRWAMLTRVP